MYKKGLLKKGRMKLITAVCTAIIVGMSCFSGFTGMAVYAEDETAEAEGSSDAETSTEVAAKNALTPKQGKISFWEWRRLDSSNCRTIFSDNMYHPVMFCMYKICDNGRNYSYHGGVSKVKDKTLSTNTSDKVHISPGDYRSTYMFLSSVTDRKHFFLPTDTTGWNNWPNDFDRVTSNLESAVAPEGCLGLYNLPGYGKEYHSTAYFTTAEQTMFIKNDNAGKWNAISESDFNSDRFFMKSDSSMGVPWMKIKDYSSDSGKQTVELVFPKKMMTLMESKAYQPGNDDFYLGCAERDDEPIITTLHSEEFPQDDYWHLIFNGNHTYLMAFNDEYRNEISFDDFGSNLYKGQTDSAYLCQVGYQNYGIMALGSKATGFIFPLVADSYSLPYGPMQRPESYNVYRPFVGYPHIFTSIPTQTVPDGKVMPFSNDMFPDATGEAAQTDGIMIPAGNTLTIDGGIVSIECDLINNGKIVVKNGGTLIIKSGGCIYPYMKDCVGSGTITCQNGGNVIVMPGGTLHSYCTGVQKTYNPYNTSTNAPILLTGGSALINYGKVSTTFVVMDETSKIENRQKGQFYVGYNRSDQFAFLSRDTDKVGKSNPANYGSNPTIGIFPLGYSFATANQVTTETAPIKDTPLEGYGNETTTQSQTVAYKTNSDYNVGTFINEKTASFYHTGSDGTDIAPAYRVNVIVPEY